MDKARSQRTRLLLLLLLVVAAVAALARSGFYRWLDPGYRRYRQGVRYAAEERTSAAVQTWEEAIKRNPLLPDPYYALADYYHERGEFERASALLRQLLQAAEKTDTMPPHLLCRLADNDFLGGRLKSAKFFAENGAQSEPDCFKAHQILGLILQYLEDSQGALRHLERAHRLAPDDTELALALAQIQMRNLHLTEAKRILREVLRRHPQSAQAHYMLGWLHANHQQGAADVQAAERHLKKCLELSPTPQAYGELGRLALQQGDDQKAKTLLQQAWSLDERSETVAYNLARVYSRLNDPRASPMWKNFERLAERRMRWEALIKRQIVEPDDVALTLETARLHMEEGQTLRAQALVQEVLEKDPSHAEARRLRRLLSRPSPPHSHPGAQP